jgi:hypothetical protein
MASTAMLSVFSLYNYKSIQIFRICLLNHPTTPDESNVNLIIENLDRELF